MKRYVLIDKVLGETPLEAIARYKREHPEHKDVRAAYAGRLDPMATGRLLILFGDECTRLTRYTSLDKEYEVEVLLDVGSDTGDVLGVVTYSGQETRVDPRVLQQALRQEQGTHMRAYPAFSSKVVEGKPLFLRALEGTLSEITIPTHQETLYSIRYRGSLSFSASELQEALHKKLSHAPVSDDPRKELGADFRIRDVRDSWNALFERASDRRFVVLRITVACGSGAYMRTLAQRIGKSVGTEALAYSLRRTRIGKRVLPGIWLLP